MTKQGISYRDFYGDERSSAGKMMRVPLSKRRNQHPNGSSEVGSPGHELSVVYEKGVSQQP